MVNGPSAFGFPCANTDSTNQNAGMMTNNLGMILNGDYSKGNGTQLYICPKSKGIYKDQNMYRFGSRMLQNGQNCQIPSTNMESGNTKKTFKFTSHQERIAMIYERVIHGSNFDEISNIFKTSKSTATLVNKQYNATGFTNRKLNSMERISLLLSRKKAAKVGKAIRQNPKGQQQKQIFHIEYCGENPEMKKALNSKGIKLTSFFSPL